MDSAHRRLALLSLLYVVEGLPFGFQATALGVSGGGVVPQPARLAAAAVVLNAKMAARPRRVALGEGGGTERAPHLARADVARTRGTWMEHGRA